MGKGSNVSLKFKFNRLYRYNFISFNSCDQLDTWTKIWKEEYI